jgi:hypothetical protein
MTLKNATLAAAVAGLLAGATGCSKGGPPAPPSSGSASSVDTQATAKHACKGQNACKGQGGCKTDTHACKGQNACKGQGGCSMS